MQKSIFTITSLALLMGLGIQQTFSQTESGSTKDKIELDDFAFSFRGGLGVSNLSGPTEGFEYSANIAVMIGVYGEYMLKEKTGLIAGVEYASKGATIKQESTVLYDNLRYDISYINLVMGIMHNVAPRLRLEAAVVPAFKSSEELTYSGAYGLIGGSSETDNVKDLDLGAMAGFSYQFNKINFGAHYTYGLLDINNDDSAGISKLQNRMLMFSLKYVLNI